MIYNFLFLQLKFAYRFGGSKISKMLVDDVYLDDGECIEGIQSLYT